MKTLWLTAITLLYANGLFAILPKDSIGVKKVKDKSFIIHKVEKGDGFLSIAKKYNVSDSAIKSSNKGLKELKIGQQVKIPITTKYLYRQNEPEIGLKLIEESHTNAESKPTNNEIRHLVLNGESLAKIALKYKVTQENIAKWNNLINYKILPGQELTVSGPLSIAPYEKWNKSNSQTKKSNLPLSLISNSKNLIEETVEYRKTDLITHANLTVGSFINCINPTNQKSILLEIQRTDSTMPESTIGVPNSILQMLELYEGNLSHIKYYSKP